MPRIRLLESTVRRIRVRPQNLRHRQIQIVAASKASTAALATLADWIVTHRPLFSGSNFERPPASLRDAEVELTKQVQWESTLAPAMLEGNGVDEYLLVRGNSNTPKEPVSRRFLEAFHESRQKQSSANSQSNGDESQPRTPGDPNPAVVDWNSRMRFCTARWHRESP